MITQNRNSEIILWERFSALITSEIPIASGKIYYGMPDEIYINTRSSASGGIEERRYPSIGIVPLKTKLHYLQNAPHIQQSSLTATGLVTIYTSNVLIEQENVLHIETTTKKDHIVYKSLFIIFFEHLKTWFTLTNDVLPEEDEVVSCVVTDIEEDLSDAPFQTIFQFKLFYRTYEETTEYLLLTGGIGGYVVSGTVSYGDYNPTGLVVNEVFVNR